MNNISFPMTRVPPTRTGHPYDNEVSDEDMGQSGLSQASQTSTTIGESFADINTRKRIFSSSSDGSVDKEESQKKKAKKTTESEYENPRGLAIKAAVADINNNKLLTELRDIINNNSKSLVKDGFLDKFNKLSRNNKKKLMEYYHHIASHQRNIFAIFHLCCVYRSVKEFKDLDKAISLYEEADRVGSLNAKDILKFWNDLHKVAFLQDEMVRKQFGMILKTLNAFIGDSAIKLFLKGQSLNVCLGDKKFLLTILQSKCTSVLEKLSTIQMLWDKSLCLKRNILLCLPDMDGYQRLPLLLDYCASYIDFSNVTLECENLHGVDLSEVDLNDAQLEGPFLKNACLNFDQMQQDNLQQIALPGCKITYQSVYQKLYQTYKILFAVNQDDSSFNIVPNEIKRIQLTMLLKAMIQEVKDKGAGIESIDEIEHWVNNICLGHVI